MAPTLTELIVLVLGVLLLVAIVAGVLLLARPVWASAGPAAREGQAPGAGDDGEVRS